MQEKGFVAESTSTWCLAGWRVGSLEHQQRNHLFSEAVIVIGGKEAHGGALRNCVAHKTIFIRKKCFLSEDRKRLLP